MLKQFFVRLLAGACALAALTSCGSRGDGTADFATVQAKAYGPGVGIDAPVVPSTAACTANVVDYTPETATYSITSVAYNPNDTGQTNSTIPSNLSIQKVTVMLNPANSATPALPPELQTQYPTSSYPPIPPTTAGTSGTTGTGTQVVVTVVPGALKQFLANQVLVAGMTGIKCTAQTLSYRATVSFELQEDSTGRTGTVTASGFIVINLSGQPATTAATGG